MGFFGINTTYTEGRFGPIGSATRAHAGLFGPMYMILEGKSWKTRLQENGMIDRPPLRMRISVDHGARQRIKGTQLVERLQDFVFADDDELVPQKRGSKQKLERRNTMSPAQVTAALALLKKIIPDMAPVQEEVEGQQEQTVVEVRRVIVRPKDFTSEPE